MTDNKTPLLAYEDSAFVNSPDGRMLRIFAEYMKPLARFRRERIQDTVVFFGSARIFSLDKAAQNLKLSNTPDFDESSSSTKRNAAEPAETPELRHAHAEAAVEMAHHYEDARKLAHLLTDWSLTIKSKRHRFVVTSGGGPGIMEAANRGASEAGGKTIGLGIHLPFEQLHNPYITPSLDFEFHYFFMRKYWFAYLAKALVVFPGGFGTLDEMFELLTLMQTQKLAKQLTILIYGSKYWNEIVNFDAMVQSGTISRADLNLFHFADSPEDAFAILKEELSRKYLTEAEQPDLPRSEDPQDVETEIVLRPEITKTRR